MVNCVVIEDTCPFGYGPKSMSTYGTTSVALAKLSW
jgi:hypothetical protein